jgi:hypothetical protein
MTTQTIKSKHFFIVFSVVVITAGLLALVLTLGLRKPESSTQDGAIEFVQADGNLIPGEDATLVMDNVTVYVPSEAIKETGSIFITSRELDLLPISDDLEWNRIQVVNVEYKDVEGNLHTHATFPSPVEICFQITAEEWSDYLQQPDDVQVQTYIEQEKMWESLKMVTHPVEYELCGETSHLSLFALAVRQKMIIPVTGATPTPSPGPYDQ